MPETEFVSSVWSPVEEARKRYPDLESESDYSILRNLANPDNFREVFPEYSHLDNATIGRNMATIAGQAKLPSRPGFTKSLFSQTLGTSGPSETLGNIAETAKMITEPRKLATGTGLFAKGLATGTFEAINKLAQYLPSGIIASAAMGLKPPPPEEALAPFGGQAWAEMGKQLGERDYPGAAGSALAGTLLGAAWLGGPKLPKDVASLPRKAESVIRIPAQDIAGAGKEPVARALRNREATIARGAETYSTKLSEAKKDYETATRVSEETAAAKDRQNLAKYEQNVAETKAKAEAEAAIKRKQWIDETIKVKNIKDQAAHVDAQRESLGIAQDEYTRLLKDNTTSTEAALTSSFKTRWNNFRDVVGRDTKLDTTNVSRSVLEAKSKFLRGSPESLKVFNDLLDEIGVTSLRGAINLDTASPEAVASLGKGLLELDLDTARIHSSAIGGKRFSGELPGNVYHALGHVQDAIESEIMNAARAKGMGKEYGSLKSDWSQYMQDWNDMSPVATGGSPLARIKRAQDPAFVSDQVRGKAGNRLIEILARYRDFGASPQLLVKLRNVRAEIRALPKTSIPETPKPLSIKATEFPPPPELSVREVPGLRAVKPPIIPPPVDPVALRKKLLETYAARPFGWFDLFPPRFIERLLTKSQAFRDWVARQPRKELQP